MTDKKIALVTGSNRGIGKEVVRQLVEKDIFVIAAGRDLAKVETALQELALPQETVAPVALDVADETSRLTAVKKILETHKRIDILVNNAAIFRDYNSLLKDLSLLDFIATINTNVFGSLHLAQLILPNMIKESFGRIVNVSSGMGAIADLHAGSGAYRVSKTALNAITKILADEVKGHNIKVNSVCPGWVRTDMGGSNATRDVSQGAFGIVWAAMLPDDGPNGGFFRDGKAISF
jgi:NAD(P)-dependent dehydrogenase (short-subunit alcohol dehydrogenase family)